MSWQDNGEMAEKKHHEMVTFTRMRWQNYDEVMRSIKWQKNVELDVKNVEMTEA